MNASRRVWVNEALFPNYLFARFALQPMLNAVRFASGVKSVVMFGNQYPSIPNEVIQDLQARLGETECIEQVPDYKPGEDVNIVAGPFMGLCAVVDRYMPAAQRIRVLLTVLGQTTPVELGVQHLNPVKRYPKPLLARDPAA